METSCKKADLAFLPEKRSRCGKNVICQVLDRHVFITKTHIVTSIRSGFPILRRSENRTKEKNKSEEKSPHHVTMVSLVVLNRNDYVSNFAGYCLWLQSVGSLQTRKSCAIKYINWTQIEFGVLYLCIMQILMYRHICSQETAIKAIYRRSCMLMITEWFFKNEHCEMVLLFDECLCNVRLEARLYWQHFPTRLHPLITKPS